MKKLKEYDNELKKLGLPTGGRRIYRFKLLFYSKKKLKKNIEILNEEWKDFVNKVDQILAYGGNIN